MLAYLVRRRGEVVRKEELLDEVWGDRFVSESALTTRIKSALPAVGDDGNRQAVIRTVHGKGYEFVANVDLVDTRRTTAEGRRPLGSGPAGAGAAIDRSRGLVGNSTRRSPAIA